MQSPEDHFIETFPSDLAKQVWSRTSSLLDDDMDYSSSPPVLLNLGVAELGMVQQPHSPTRTNSSYVNRDIGLIQDSDHGIHLQTDIAFEPLNVSPVYNFKLEELSRAASSGALFPGDQINQLGASISSLHEPSQLVLYESPCLYTSEYVHTSTTSTDPYADASGLLAQSTLSPLNGYQDSAMFHGNQKTTFLDSTTSKKDYANFIPLDYNGNTTNMNIPIRKQRFAQLNDETTNWATYLPHLILPRAKQVGAEYISATTPFNSQSTYQLDYTHKKIEKPIEDVVKQMTKKWDNSRADRCLEVFDATTTNQESFLNFCDRKYRPCPAKKALAHKERGNLKNGHFFFGLKQLNKMYSGQ